MSLDDSKSLQNKSFSSSFLNIGADRKNVKHRNNKLKSIHTKAKMNVTLY